ncbi:MOSC domain-containing protein (plasmid) [Rhizobium leguminosarum]|uniref:MOSC domain-containing protein n=1 Tax=Rhizobium leguminosarum TaxID=384 RepID=UPI0010323ABE|nr:MOSC domain-containing protein [Rhizobium leguminosarum]TAU14222.1 MOSC domain-containing protein [Rhizobium leguminosarum]TAU36290.1 MOSC domain-containing protein [Rhizobium leguminosarum]
MDRGQVIAVATDDKHRFSKRQMNEIHILAGLGVEGDAHLGVTVKHRSRIRADPSQPNLRQVHLIQAELLDELADQGFKVGPADLGENITTRCVDLLALPRGTVLKLGANVELQVTGLRNPCSQIDNLQPGLLKAVLGRGPNGELIRKTGVMTIVLKGGVVVPGDAIAIEFPVPPLLPLEVV